MTIAACYVSDEGVVFGADSTTTEFVRGGSIRYFCHAQKIFQVGETGSTLGWVTWGRNSLPNLSYRRIVAELSDDLLFAPPKTFAEVMDRWNERFWPQYSTRLADDLQAYKALKSNMQRSEEEEVTRRQLKRALSVGFCIGGRISNDRTPRALAVLYHPELDAAPAAIEVDRHQPAYWGVHNLANRLLVGIDEELYQAIVKSKLWTGTQNDLNSLIRPHVLKVQPEIPLREAIDWIYSSIFVTIKALKFSPHPMLCGGRIEVAAVTVDRAFRWVCHKPLDAALYDQIPEGVG